MPRIEGDASRGGGRRQGRREGRGTARQGDGVQQRIHRVSLSTRMRAASASPLIVRTIFTPYLRGAPGAVKPESRAHEARDVREAVAGVNGDRQLDERAAVAIVASRRPHVAKFRKTGS